MLWFVNIRHHLVISFSRNSSGGHRMTLYSKLLNSSLLFIAGAVLALAADPTGTITGTVTDPTGGAVAGAKVTATALNTGLSRSLTTANDGGFVFPLMPVGAYSV